jgi:hypothetical protein
MAIAAGSPAESDLWDQVRISRGVWLPADAAADALARLAALLAALPPRTVFSGSTAAALHELEIPPSAAIDVTVGAHRRPPSHTTGPRRPELVTHRRILCADEVTEVRGLPVTSVSRTWCDLAEVLSLGDLVAAGDSAIRLGRVTPEQLAAAIRRRRSHRGVRAARQAVSLLDGRARSRPESRLRVVIALAGLPPPAVNVAILDDTGGWLAEPDLSYREARLGIEYQGSGHAEPRQYRRDVARHMDLHRAGWEILYYTADQVFGHPEVIARDVRSALRQRAPDLLRRQSS